MFILDMFRESAGNVGVASVSKSTLYFWKNNPRYYVTPTEIHRNRFPVDKLFIRNEIWSFIKNYCRPFTDIQKVKLINGESCQTYYRSTSLSNLYLNFLKTSFIS